MVGKTQEKKPDEKAVFDLLTKRRSVNKIGEGPRYLREYREG